jgi:hypothetical protein
MAKYMPATTAYSRVVPYVQLPLCGYGGSGVLGPYGIYRYHTGGVPQGEQPRMPLRYCS